LYYWVSSDISPDDKPSKEIVENDAEFDAWLIRYDRLSQKRIAKYKRVKAEQEMKSHA
jgi:hypothetical protein